MSHSHDIKEQKHEESQPLFDIIRTRRSIRKYQGKDVPFGMVAQILDAAKYAPFPGNVMNMKLIVVKGEEKRKAIAESCAQQYWMAQAPVHIVVVGEPEKIEKYYGVRGIRVYTPQSIGAAIQNMLLCAHSLSLGTCWVGAFDSEAIRTICNMPEHLDIHAVITVGYPAESPSSPPKSRIEHMMFFEKWWGRIESPKNALGMWTPTIQKGVSRTKSALQKAKEKLRETFGKKYGQKHKDNHH